MAPVLQHCFVLAVKPYMKTLGRRSKEDTTLKMQRMSMKLKSFWSPKERATPSGATLKRARVRGTTHHASDKSFTHRIYRSCLENVLQNDEVVDKNAKWENITDEKKDC